MFLGSISYRRPPRVTRLPKSHSSIPSTSRAQACQTRICKGLFHVYGKHLQLTHSQRSTSLQHQKSCRNKSTSTLLANIPYLNSTAITLPQGSQSDQTPDLTISELRKSKGAPESVKEKELRSSSERKILRRKAIAERARKHKEHKRFINERLKDRGLTSQDWRIPLAVLEANSSTGNVKSKEHLRTREVWSMQRPKLCQLHIDQIERPAIWTDFTFYNYVEDLAMSSVNRLIQRRFYAKGDSHTAAVSRRLEEIFKAPTSREFLSPRAFNVALSFFYKTCQVPKAMALFVYMEWLRMEIPPETVSIMLRGTATYKDLHNFTRLLRIFISRGIKPTAIAWTALIQAVESREGRATIIHRMRTRNLLDQFATMREIVRLVIGEDIAKHLDDGLDLASFLASMDAQYGTEWLSYTAGNIILYEVGQRKSIIEAFETLEALMQCGMPVTVVTMNILLQLSSQERDHLFTIRILRFLQADRRIKPDGRTYEILFMQAWRSRLYNFARVVWTSACTEGLTTFKMQSIIKDNFLCNRPDTFGISAESRAKIWSRSAAQVIAGTTQAEKLDEIFHPNTWTNESTSKSRDHATDGHDQLMDGLPMKGSRLIETRRRALAALIAKDIAMAGRYHFTDHFFSLLSKALELDRSWMQSRAWKEKSPQWKRENALVVQIDETGRLTGKGNFFKEDSAILVRN